MNVRKQICTREQGEKLEELGITGKPVFCWCLIHSSYEDEGKLDILPTEFELAIPDLATTWVAPAFTSSELGHMFPPGYYTWFDGTYWHCGDDIGNERHMIGFTEAETRAAELISLLESGLFTADEVNKRIIV